MRTAIKKIDELKTTRRTCLGFAVTNALFLKDYVFTRKSINSSAQMGVWFDDTSALETFSLLCNRRNREFEYGPYCEACIRRVADSSKYRLLFSKNDSDGKKSICRPSC